MKYLVLCTLFSFASASYQILFDPELDGYWENYKKIYKKQYGKNEDDKRRLIWEENVAGIVRHNLNADLGFYSYRQGLNAFTDMEHSEFMRIYNDVTPRINLRPAQIEWTPMRSMTTVPDSMDWRNEGCVTPVKDQRKCGAGWAFAATGALEGQHKIKNGTLVRLSEQQLIDCSAAYGNKGCNGGSPLAAYAYISHNGGLDTESSYPYTEQPAEPCLFDNQTIGATCRTGKIVTGFNETLLQEAVANVGPIAVGIDASQESFMKYSSGVYFEPKCNPDVLNHYVLVVGYGREWGQDFWLVKNSYGPNWGRDGYIQIARNSNNTCGIATYAVYPIV